MQQHLLHGIFFLNLQVKKYKKNKILPLILVVNVILLKVENCLYKQDGNRWKK